MRRRCRSLYEYLQNSASPGSLEGAASEVLAIAASVASRNDADDLSQEVLLAIFGSLQAGQVLQRLPEPVLRRYVYKIARNRHVDMLRRRGSRGRRAAEYACDAGDSHPSAADEAQHKEALERALSTDRPASVRERDWHLWRAYLEGVPSKTLALVHGLSTRTVSRTIRKVRKALGSSEGNSHDPTSGLGLV
jgi:RNA polymerase sigma factor (sigma-70 family)